MEIRPKSNPIVYDGITLEQLYHQTGHKKDTFVERCVLFLSILMKSEEFPMSGVSCST